jgi:hypothetical protein
MQILVRPLDEDMLARMTTVKNNQDCMVLMARLDTLLTVMEPTFDLLFQEYDNIRDSSKLTLELADDMYLGKIYLIHAACNGAVTLSAAVLAQICLKAGVDFSDVHFFPQNPVQFSEEYLNFLWEDLEKLVQSVFRRDATKTYFYVKDRQNKSNLSPVMEAMWMFMDQVSSQSNHYQRIYQLAQGAIQRHRVIFETF